MTTDSDHRDRESLAYDTRPSKESALIAGTICWAAVLVLAVLAVIIGSVA